MAEVEMEGLAGKGGDLYINPCIVVIDENPEMLRVRAGKGIGDNAGD
jgi:hypothetical protein